MCFYPFRAGVNEKIKKRISKKKKYIYKLEHDWPNLFMIELHLQVFLILIIISLQLRVGHPVPHLISTEEECVSPLRRSICVWFVVTVSHWSHIIHIVNIPNRTAFKKNKKNTGLSVMYPLDSVPNKQTHTEHLQGGSINSISWYINMSETD